MSDQHSKKTLKALLLQAHRSFQPEPKSAAVRSRRQSYDDVHIQLNDNALTSARSPDAHELENFFRYFLSPGIVALVACRQVS